MKLIQEVVMPYDSGRSFIVKKGQRIRIISETIVDFIAFNLDNLKERFCQARTKVHNNKIYISTEDKLYSKFSNIMMTIVEDTYRGHHDLQFAGCSKFGLELISKLIESGDPATRKCFGKLEEKQVGKELNLHGCWENLRDGLKGYDIAYEDIPSTFNLFQNIEIGLGGELIWKLEDYRPEPDKPDHIDLYAEMNCLIALSVCPSGGTIKKPVRVQVFKE